MFSLIRAKAKQTPWSSISPLLARELEEGHTVHYDELSKTTPDSGFLARADFADCTKRCEAFLQQMLGTLTKTTLYPLKRLILRAQTELDSCLSRTWLELGELGAVLCWLAAAADGMDESACRCLFRAPVDGAHWDGRRRLSP